MKRVYPSYYPQFHCVADKCGHTCCVGWEIDINPAALRRYDAMGGEMGDRLRASIARDENGARFILDENERCPLLNKNGLCDLITEAGEGALCQICRDHPRFRLRLTDREEMGLGLCCEAACKLILDWKEPVQLMAEDDGKSKAKLNWMEAECLEARDRLFDMLALRDAALTIETMLHQFYGFNLMHTPRYWAKYFMRLEHMEDSWMERLQRLQHLSDREAWVMWGKINERTLRNLFQYFLYRYFIWGWKENRSSYNGHVGFIALSVHMIVWLCEKPQDIYEVARQYSAEIEYSDVNVKKLIDKFDRYAREHQ